MKFGKDFDGSVRVVNYAVNGMSTKSFLNGGRWTEPVYEKLQPGDYVFIQFGHNDANTKRPERHTNAYTTFRENLVRYVTETREKGATPILLTSIVRRRFSKEGAFIGTHEAYTEVTRDVAKEMGVILLDMELQTEKMATLLEQEESKKMWIHLEPGENENYPKGEKDDTHLCEEGAEVVAEMVVDDLKRQGILTDYIK